MAKDSATRTPPHPNNSPVEAVAASGGVPLLARDVMTSNLLTVTADDGLLLTWELMTQAGVHHVPVLDNGRCIGLAEANVIAMECVRDPLGRRHRLIREVVPPSSLRVTDDTTVELVAKQLLATGNTAAVVSNAAGQLVGLITVNDLLRVIARETAPRSNAEPVTTTATLFRLMPVLPCVVDSPTPPTLP